MAVSSPFATRRSFNDGPWGNVILSQHPITRSEELSIYSRGGLTAVISTRLVS
jgi:hypothetical protein